MHATVQQRVTSWPQRVQPASSHPPHHHHPMVRAGPANPAGSQGDGLAQALLHAPAMFFSDDFSIQG